ncbi:MAG: alpha-amylase [Oscillospiraceae bacterium]|nr:alpha-amylase [Oscillospiraceae bacterium]
MENGIMFQGFEWYLPADGNYYRQMADTAEALRRRGVTAIWLPPVCKGTSDQDVGYGIYDLYDLGEFDQKGTVRTKYGTKAELLQLIRRFHDVGIQVYADVVLNHKAGADFTETVEACLVNPANRMERQSEPHEIEAWTGFNFPGRQGKYSDYEWHWQNFSGTDFDQRSGQKGIYMFTGDNKVWSTDVSQENGNFDYLMYADIDYANPSSRQEILRWSDWFVRETGVDGFRMDAVKHISALFMKDFVTHVHETQGPDFFFVSEYWQNNPEELSGYLDRTEHRLRLFDVVLHYHFFEAGQTGEAYDLRQIFEGTEVHNNPLNAVTFVDNHDSQPGQSLESTVEPWFKPLAYALILLRESGYPCVFMADYYGSANGSIPAQREVLDRLMALRRRFSYGEQTDYFSEAQAIGWVRAGEGEHPAPLVVVLTNKEATTLRMAVGARLAGEVFADYLGNSHAKVTIDEEGWAEFPVQSRSVSCWLPDGLPLALDQPPLPYLYEAKPTAAAKTAEPAADEAALDQT